MSNNAGSSRLDPERRREQILAAAARLLAAGTYERVSVSEVATEAGVTRALVYHYFPGKEALVEALLRRESEALLAATMPSPGVSPRANLAGALNAYLDHFAAAGTGLRELYTPTATSPLLVWELSRSNHEVQIARLREFLDLPADDLTGLALGAWLAFVEQVARGVAEGSVVTRAEALTLCFTALEASTGRRVP